MKTNLELTMEALTIVQNEYKLAIREGKSFIVLSQIKVRLDLIKELLIDMLTEERKVA